jgi:hypothetical protein
MKKTIPLLTLALGLTLFSCQSSFNGSSSSSSGTGSSEVSSTTSSEVSSTIPEKPYNEPSDSLEGVDASDLSALKDAFDNMSNNYKNESITYYNDEAVKVVNSIFKTDYIQDRTTLVNENYRYAYNEDGRVNEGLINSEGLNKFFKIALIGETLEDKLSSTIEESSIVDSEKEGLIEDNYFGFEDLNSDYVDTYGPTDKYLGWTRVSENKYRCDRREVFDSFMNLTAPYCPYGGAYMTFSHVTVELGITEDIDMRIRVYASSTQSGKMIPDHLKQEEKPNWYLLFVESLISDVGEVSIPAFENYLNTNEGVE